MGLAAHFISGSSLARFELVFRNGIPVDVVVVVVVVARTRTDIAGRAFSVDALSVWNSLPPDIRLCDTTTAIFKRHLKTHLFSQT